MAENTNTEREAVARAIWAVLRENEDRCDQELEDVPPTHHVWACADAARASLSLPAAGQEPVAWPTNAAEVREFIGVHMDSVRYHRDDAQPHEDDKYALSAHDLLSAFRWWAEDAAPQPAVAAGWMPIETAPKDGRCLLLFYKNLNGLGRTVVATWVTDEEAAETDTDCVGLEAGWYERVDNWDDYSQVAIHEGEPTHWMPLPPAPSTEGEDRG